MLIAILLLASSYSVEFCQNGTVSHTELSVRVAETSLERPVTEVSGTLTDNSV